MPHLFYIVFVFALGACIGSFLNVVVYRLPQGISLVSPPSRCPDCMTRLAWYDNVPVLGWIALRGRCRYCNKPISPRYPIVEAVTGLLFVFYYVMFYIVHAGPVCDTSVLNDNTPWFCGDFTYFPHDCPIYFLYMLLVSGLLAASLIDAELYIIPAAIPWCIGAIAIVVHAIFDRPELPGQQLVVPASLSLSVGAAIGLIISIILLARRILPMSFERENLLEVEREALAEKVAHAERTGEQPPDIPPEYTPAQVRHEMRKEMLFLTPPLVLGGISLALFTYVPDVRHFWVIVFGIRWLNAGIGSLLGGLLGGFVVWLIRIFGSYLFGKEAMGLGDVHLMAAVGAVLGGGAATIAFFIAPFFTLVVAIYLLVSGTRRQLPFGPYLSLATGFTMLFYPQMAGYLEPGAVAFLHLVHQFFGGPVIALIFVIPILFFIYSTIPRSR